jgi:hypothetical protein
MRVIVVLWSALISASFELHDPGAFVRRKEHQIPRLRRTIRKRIVRLRSG